MSTPLAESTMRRLAFIRYLYTQAVEQSRQPEPMAAASILTFHDAVELFLHLTLIHLGESKKQPNFMDYWDILAPKLKPAVLGQKEPMRRLNDPRGALKHQGTLPAALEIEETRVNVGNFFRESTPIVFDVDFDSVSLIDLVACAPARTSLARAEAARAAGDLQDAQTEIARAFAYLLESYNLSTNPRSLRFPVRLELPLVDLESVVSEIREEQSHVRRFIWGLQERVDIIGAGINYPHYLRFRALTPRVIRVTVDEGYEDVRFDSWTPPESLSSEHYKSCLDFVIESALRLQRG